ncbi:MAG: carbamoyl-phosphate synthase small subunit, partial [Deltaproteobacteria bacterium]|nr:carbamoyl-phosphate synthase small subunit [Deltaproteobacteria bacterium]
MKPAFLALADGSLFQGRSIGSDGETSGELIFNTAMCGYGEVLSDPSYRRQIVAMTSPHIGNYGIASGMYESDRFQAAGFVIRSLTEIPSTTELHAIPLREALQKEGIVAIDGIDVRQLTRQIRTEGTIPAAIVAGKDATIERAAALAKSAPSMTGAHLVPEVSTRYSYTVFNERVFLTHDVILYDFGVKRSIINNLVQRGCAVTVVPQNTPAKDVLKRNPSGVVLSN